jgi:hypothetical protein
MAKCLKRKFKLETNSFCKDRPNTWHYCIIFVFDQKLLKNIPLPLNRIMNSLVGPLQINFASCRWSLQFFGVVTFLSISSFTLDLPTWSLFSISNALGFLCFLQGLTTPAFEKLQQWKENSTISSVIGCHRLLTIDLKIVRAHSITTYL